MNDNLEMLDWNDDETLINEGYPGNSDNTIKRFHGWRGTTNDIAVYAHGVRVCTKSIIKNYKSSIHYIVEFCTDLVK